MPREGEPGYKVGYGRPPRHTQFAKGQSGNPRGRPAGSKNLRTLLARELDQPVRVVENGKRRTIPKRQVMIAQLVNQSAAGDLRAAKMIFDLQRDLEPDGRQDIGEGRAAAERDPEDQAIIERFLAKAQGAANG